MTSAPRAFRSRGRPGDLGIVDEAAFVDDLDEVLKAALAFLTWGGRLRLISTHNGEASPFNLLLRDVRDGRQPGSVHTIPFRQAIDDGLTRRVERNAAVMRAALDGLRERHPDRFTAVRGRGMIQGLVCAQPAEAGRTTSA